MLLHVSCAALHSHHTILICTVDKDVVVLNVSVVQSLREGTELWLAFEIGKNFSYLAAHEIFPGPGSEKAGALPMFHALTGCGTMSSFVGHGTKTAWATWKVLAEVTGTLLTFSMAPNDVPQHMQYTALRGL